MSDEETRNSMKAMAWERAKGELRSIYHLYYSDGDDFEAFENNVEAFIKRIEDYAVGGFL